MEPAPTFYIAAKAASAEATVTAYGTALEARGWVWTKDWTTDRIEKPYLEHRPTNAGPAQAMKAAAAGSTLIVLVPDDDLYGALLEIGIGIGAGATIAIVGDSRQSIFWCLPQVHTVDDLDDLLHLADRLAAGTLTPQS